MRLKRVSINHGRHGVRCVVKSVYEFEAERDQQRPSEQQVRKDAGVVNARKIFDEMASGVDASDQQRDAEDHHADSPRSCS